MTSTDRRYVLGIVGGGQLARMMHQAAIGLGITVRVLAEGPDVSAAQVVADVTVGDYTDPATLTAFARGCDVITFDHEHVPTALLAALERRFPGLGEYVSDQMAIAIDGELHQDALGEHLGPDSEVVLIPKISGG